MWLVCAATEGELSVWGEALFPDCDRVVSGVGIPATYATLLPIVSAHDYALIVNIGIAGAYPSSGLVVGDLVVGVSETFADLGMELPDAPGFQTITQTPFGDYYSQPFPTVPLPSELVPAAPHTLSPVSARGATVNSCTGTDATGRLRENLFSVQFETMEGAAVAHIGQICGVPVSELRAISNIAGRRDMQPKNIGRALRNLREYLEACTRKR